MYIETFQLVDQQRRALTGPRFSADKFDAAVLLLQAMLIVIVAPLSGYAYYFYVYGNAGSTHDFVSIGVLVALFYALPQTYEAYHRSRAPLRSPRDFRRVLVSWHFAFFCVLSVVFLTKSSLHYSRGWIVGFYVIGLIAIVASEVAIFATRRAMVSAGRLLARRLLVVSCSDDPGMLARRGGFDAHGIDIAGMVHITQSLDHILSTAERPGSLVQQAIAEARRHNVSDIVIVTSWNDARLSALIAEKFLDVPAAVHITGLDVFEQFSKLSVDHVGPMTTVVIRQQPLNTLQAAIKRGFDILVAGAALVFLAPVFALTALLIRYDTRGPAFFLQRRRGLNHKEFRIFKFRTMTTADDGDRIVQATKNDPRITRIGGILRKYNIDELPQLINVLLGHMSLVGPRPHAVAHDGYYERLIDRYARRLNMRPGITGWAQVNGHRGETATKAAMEARLEHDLYYIENWSGAFDIYILLMTVLSRKSYRNAV